MIPFSSAVAAEVRALVQGADGSTIDSIYRELCQVTTCPVPSPPRSGVASPGACLFAIDRFMFCSSGSKDLARAGFMLRRSTSILGPI
jgi:hypothetical protein